MANIEIGGVKYPEKEPDRGYGMFGYESDMLNMAACLDHLEGFQYWLELKDSTGARFFTKESRDFMERNLLGFVLAKGAEKIAARLYDDGLRFADLDRKGVIRLAQKTRQLRGEQFAPRENRQHEARS